MANLTLDFRQADASYIAFPEFDKWIGLTIDTKKWDKYLHKVQTLASNSPESLEHAQRIVRRYAAIETGAIEKLYSVDRGFTYTVAFELAGMESLLAQKGADTINLIESQLNGYDYILDIVTSNDSITESWVRQLHHVLCKEQKNFSVLTPQGPQKRPLPLGEYKNQPNHVVRADGTVHSYCPVDMVGAEMHRCLQTVRSDSFKKIHPVIQSAFIHYAFVKIHPFSDGNGRVARTLASIFLYRDASVPLLIMSEDRNEYINVLESADQGSYQDFIDFILERTFSAIDLIEMSAKTGTKQSAEESLEKLGAFYITKGGYTHEEVDAAAKALMSSLKDYLDIEFNTMQGKDFLQQAAVTRQAATYQPISNNHRLLLNKKGEDINLSLISKTPAEANVMSSLEVHIPKDCGDLDDFIILNRVTEDQLSVRISEIIPSIKSSLEMKLGMFAETSANELAARLFEAAQAKYRS